MIAKSGIGPVLISGCSSGLGDATARAFHEAGHLMVATARNVENLAGLKARGCETLPLDVTDEASCCSAIEAVEQRFGPVGVLIDNAGHGQYGPLVEISPELLHGAFATNVFGLLRMAQLALPGMRRAGRGRIVNISSITGRVTAQGGGVYHMTKYAVEAIDDALRPEVKPFGIAVVPAEEPSTVCDLNVSRTALALTVGFSLVLNVAARVVVRMPFRFVRALLPTGLVGALRVIAGRVAVLR